MRAPASLQGSIRHFGIWRAAVLAIAMLVALALLAWAVAQPPVTGTWKLALVALLLAVDLACVASLWRSRPHSLRWDGQDWHLGWADAAGQEPWPGELGVAMDLGSWMLLRFRHAPLGRWSRWTWIPVLRWGLEPDWHALRCALFCPRSPPGAVAGDAGFPT